MLTLWMVAALADQCEDARKLWSVAESLATCTHESYEQVMGVSIAWYAVFPDGHRMQVRSGNNLPAGVASWEMELTTSEPVFVTVEILGPSGDPLPVFAGDAWWYFCPRMAIRQPLPSGTKPTDRIAVAVSRDRPLAHAFRPAMEVVPLIEKGGASWARGDTAFCLPVDLPTSTVPQVKELKWEAPG